MPSDPEPTTPRELLGMYLAHRETELAKSTLDAHERRLMRFVRWCEGDASIDEVADITGRVIHRWRVWRQGEGSTTDLSPETIRSELLTLRVFLRFAASIDAVSSEVAENIVIPDESKRSRSVMIESDHRTLIEETLEENKIRLNNP